jgi:hypothetical protein
MTEAKHTETNKAASAVAFPAQEVQARIGFFEKNTHAESCFGYLGIQEGWQIGIFSRQDRILAQLLQAPVEADGWMAGGLAAIWRNGDILPLQLPQFLEVGDLILCGPAAFLCEESSQKGQMRLQRRWLWLPQDETWTLQSAALTDILQQTLALSHHTAVWSVRVEPARLGHVLVTPQAAPALRWLQEAAPNLPLSENTASLEKDSDGPMPAVSTHSLASTTHTHFALCVGDSSQGASR